MMQQTYQTKLHFFLDLAFQKKIKIKRVQREMTLPSKRSKYLETSNSIQLLSYLNQTESKDVKLLCRIECQNHFHPSNTNLQFLEPRKTIPVLFQNRILWCTQQQQKKKRCYVKIYRRQKLAFISHEPNLDTFHPNRIFSIRSLSL